MANAVQLYHPLAEDRIRLFTLAAGSWGDEIRGNLFEASFDQRYVAVSYAWSSTRPVRDIQVNGFVKRITFNLNLVLRTVRKFHQPVTLWVDSLCIDQENVEEKNSQVNSMHKIFSLADNVWAYLGEGIDRSDSKYHARLNKLGMTEPFEYPEKSEEAWYAIEDDLKELSTIKAADIPTNQRCRCIFSLFRALSDPVISENICSHDIFTASTIFAETQLEDFFEWVRAFIISPWWNRAWIVQEAGVGKDLSITYGRITLPFEVLMNAVSQLQLQSRLFETISRSKASATKVLTLLIQKTATVSELRQLHHAGFRADLNSVDHRARSLDSPMLWLLRTFRHRLSSDPRDKVYALSQLLKGSQERSSHDIAAQYGLPRASLYSQVVLEIIKETGIFWITSTDLVGKVRDGLPSWVPDWSDAMFSPDPHCHTWQIRLCFNVGNIAFRHGDEGEYTELGPPEHFRTTNKVVTRVSETKGMRLITRSGCKVDSDGRELPVADIFLNIRTQYLTKIVAVLEPFTSGLSNIRKIFLWHLLYLGFDARSIEKLVEESIKESIKELIKESIESIEKLDEESIEESFEESIQELTQELIEHEESIEESIEAVSSYLTFHPNFAKACCFGVKNMSNGMFSRLVSADDTALVLWVYRFVLPFRWEVIQPLLIVQRDFARSPREDPVDREHSTIDLENSMTEEEAWGIWGEQVNQIHTLAEQMTSGQRLYITKNKKVGLGPSGIARRDQVHILDSGLCLYILRRISDKGFQLVGDYYF